MKKTITSVCALLLSAVVSLNAQNQYNDIYQTENTPPNVSVKSITSSNNFIAQGTVSITANASDVDGTISKVEYYEGGKLLATSLIAPYVFNYAPAAAGLHNIVIKAYDNLGANSSAYAQFMVDQIVLQNMSPTVVLSNPVSTKIYNKDAPVTIIATPSDVDGTISSVHFYEDETEICVATAAPYTCVWIAKSGIHVIKAIAFDNKGASGMDHVDVTANQGAMCDVPAWNANTYYKKGDVVSYNNTLIVCIVQNVDVHPASQLAIQYWKTGNRCVGANRPPNVVITSPVNNTVYLKPATITVTANAWDTDGDISKVVFRRDGIVIGEKTSSPYTITFASKAGVSFYAAQAFDNEGDSATSALVYVYSNFSNGCTVFPYYPYTSYPAGSLVSINSSIYKANVATQNQSPLMYNGVGEPWTLVGPCNLILQGEPTTEVINVEEAVVNVLSLYPNPSNGMVTVKLEMHEKSNVTLKVLNVTGAEVAQRSYNAATSINEEMNLSHLSSGLYFVHVMVNDQLKVEKLVVE